MSILNTIKEWFFGKETKDNAEAAPYKVEPPSMEPPTLNALGETPTWPFPSRVGAIPVEGAGVVEVKTEAPAKKPKVPAKPKAVKAVAAKPKAEAKPKAKPAAKPKTEAKPKAVKAVAAKPKASKKA